MTILVLHFLLPNSANHISTVALLHIGTSQKLIDVPGGKYEDKFYFRKVRSGTFAIPFHIIVVERQLQDASWEG